MNNRQSSLIDTIFSACPVRNILARVSDKWSILILHELRQAASPRRFSELQKKMPDISQKMLTQTLRTLEQDGYVSRVVFAEVPPRVEYHITSLGDSFMDACRPMVDWAIAHFAEVIKNRSPYIQNADNT